MLALGGHDVRPWVVQLLAWGKGQRGDPGADTKVVAMTFVLLILLQPLGTSLTATFTGAPL